MTDDVRELLLQPVHPPEIVKLLDHCVELIDMSRSDMSKRYEDWDMACDAYAGERVRDREDKEALKHGEPEKMVVQLTYSQVQTLVAFCMMLFTQNRRFYEVVPTGDEDFELRDVIELIQERETRANKWPVFLYQLLVDFGRMGIAVAKSGWEERKMTVRVETEPTVEQQEIVGDDGVAVTQDVVLGGGAEEVEVTTYEGTKVTVVSPYLFFPDTRVPMSRLHEGEFCACEEEILKKNMRLKEKEGYFVGTKFAEPLDGERVVKRKHSRISGLKRTGSRGQLNECYVWTECQIYIVPSEYGLGEEDYPVPYVVHIINDRRVVRLERMEFWHGEFTYDVAEFSPDLQYQLSQSLSDVTGKIQDVVTWLINSRVANVRRFLENHAVVDPLGVDMASVESRSPIIKVKPGMSGLGVDKYYKQLDVKDATMRHLDDANAFVGLMQLVTGINENAMGQYASGRRSATEARAVTAGASAKLKTLAEIVWSMCLGPLGRKIMINARQSMSQETYLKIVGSGPESLLYPQFASSPEALIGSEDYFVFDSTLPSEKGYAAESLQELFIQMISNPVIFQMMGLDPRAMLEEIYALRGIKNLNRFRANEQSPFSQLPAGTGGESVGGPAAGIPPVQQIPSAL